MRWLSGICAGLIVGWASLTAAGEVGLLGDTTKLVIEGASSYQPAQLQLALAFDYEYQVAARPSAELDDLLRTIEARLTVGYRQAGHTDARITARHDEASDRVIVHVEEGVAIVAGDVRIEGSQQIDRQQIIRWLDEMPSQESLRRRVQIVKSFVAGAPYRDDDATKGEEAEKEEKKKAKALFVPGKPGSFDRPTLTKIRSRIEDALAEQRLLFADFDVVFDTDEEEKQVDLVVHVADEGPPAVVDEIQITGLEKNERAAVLNHLELETGAPLSRKLLDDIETGLRHCGRFWSYDVRPVVHLGPKQVELQIDVEEYPHVPPLGQPLTAELEAVRKVGVWLDTLDERGEGLELHVDGHGLAGNRLALAVSSREGIAVDVRTPGEEGWHIDHAGVLLRDFIAIYSRACGRKFEVELTEELTPQVTFALTPQESYEGEKSMSINYRMGIGSEGSEYFTSKAHPVALIRSVLKEKDQVTIDGAQLTVAAEGLTLKANATTGELHTITAEGLEIRIAPGSVRKMARRLKEHARETENDYDPDAGLLSFAAFLVHEYAHFAKENGDDDRALAAESFAQWFSREGRQLVGNVDRELRYLVDGRGKAGHRFWIKQSGPRIDEDATDAQRLFVRYGPAIVDWLHPRGSAAWTLQREYCFRRANPDDSRYYDEARRLMASGDLGPLGCWVSWVLAAQDEDQTLVNAVLRYALTRLDEEHLRHELELLLAEDSGGGKIVDFAGRLLRVLSLEQLRTIISLAPEKRQKQSLAVLWVAMRKWPDRTPSEAIVEYGVQQWRDELKAKYQRELTDVLTADKKKETDALRR